MPSEHHNLWKTQLLKVKPMWKTLGRETKNCVENNAFRAPKFVENTGLDMQPHVETLVLNRAEP